MRIVLSNASPYWGGVHTITEALLLGLHKRGHEVVVFCRPNSRLEQRLSGMAPIEPILEGMDLSPRAGLRVARALRRHRPDVMLTLTKKDVRLSSPVARLMGVPVVVRHANDQPLGRSWYYRMLYGAIPAHHVTNAEATRLTLLRSAKWLNGEDVSVIRNGIDIPTFDAAPRATLDTRDGEIVIGYLGSLEPRKGVLDLAQAWRDVADAIPNATLVIAGSGSQEDEIRAALADAPRARMLGYRADAASVVKAFDVLVLPSYVEGAPNVVQEAMLAGKPVIATAVSGTPELVADGVTGLLVPPHSPARIAECIVALCCDTRLRERMGAAGRETAVQQFALEQMLDHYEALLQRVALRVSATPREREREREPTAPRSSRNRYRPPSGRRSRLPRGQARSGR